MNEASSSMTTDTATATPTKSRRTRQQKGKSCNFAPLGTFNQGDHVFLRDIARMGRFNGRGIVRNVLIPGKIAMHRDRATLKNFISKNDAARLLSAVQMVRKPGEKAVSATKLRTVLSMPNIPVSTQMSRAPRRAARTTTHPRAQTTDTRPTVYVSGDTLRELLKEGLVRIEVK